MLALGFRGHLGALNYVIVVLFLPIAGSACAAVGFALFWWCGVRIFLQGPSGRSGKGLP